jgi:hypothetical protein
LLLCFLRVVVRNAYSSHCLLPVTKFSFGLTWCGNSQVNYWNDWLTDD